MNNTFTNSIVEVVLKGNLYKIYSYIGTSEITVSLLSESGDLISGCLVDIHTGLISSVITQTPYRRMGFCECLLRFVIDTYNANNLFVRIDNFPAICLYSKLGFKVTSRVPMPGGTVSYIMERV